ncbi:branched-chain amino acid ABC transporter substrate-binding protein [Variovorax paradoxus]|uniref:branched-chain amino acid ABC transporter substrate-binding protein n=1 Tax=Variovorax paradoxus TaxID=34073 RepID=UPI0019343A4B|nr:branched-chain amino acid ABC transporter substrate-binding protein [Variovorax paradoxus]
MRRLLLVAASLGLWASLLPASAQDLVVKIGHAGPLSGPQANAGRDNERGVKLAIADLNAQDFRIGGRRARFELVSEDDQGDPRTGTQVAQKMVDSGVRAVIGHYNSGVSIPASRIYSQEDIPMITGASSNPQLTRQGFASIFRLAANDNVMGAAMAEFAAARGLRKVAVIDDRTAYGTGVADIFVQTAKGLGLEVVGREFTSDKATDFTAILTKFKGLAPEAVFLGGYYAQGAGVARQMRQLDINALLLGGDGICTAEVVPLGGKLLEGRYFCAQSGRPLDSLPGGPAFRERFTKTFDAPIDAYAPAFYVATLVVARAMQQAGSDEPKKVTAALKTLKMESMLGPVQFDATGEWLKAPVTAYQIAGGKLVPVERKP